MATGVKSWSSTVANNASADSNINFAEGQAPSTVNDSARYVMKGIADWYAQIAGGVVQTGTVGGTGNAITLTCSPTVDTLATGQAYMFALTANVTGTVALVVDSLASKAVKYRSTALVSGDGGTGDLWFVVYNGTDYELINPPRLSAQTTDYTTDTTGGDVADLFYFADASQSNASNKVTAQKMMDNLLAALTAKATPVPADYLMLADTAASNVAKSATLTNVFQAIIGLTAKATPVVADTILLSDSAASNAAVRATLTQLLTAVAATQANQETATSVVLPVTPGRQQFHPSACKAWVVFAPGGSPTAAAGYNISGIVKNGTGDYTITFTTAFSSANYSAHVTAESAGATGRDAKCGPRTASTAEVFCFNTASGGVTETDIVFIHAQFFGDQ